MNEPADVPKASKPRRHFSLQQKADYLERFLQSGLSMAEFCRQTQLAPTCLQRWLKLLEPSPKPSTSPSPPLFQELTRSEPSLNHGWSVELSRANGNVLRLAGPLSTQLLAQLLSVC